MLPVKKKMWQEKVTFIERIDCTISGPQFPRDLFKILNISRRNLSRYLCTITDMILVCVIQTRPASCSLAVEHTNNSSAFVQIPNLQKT
jgi:hypothetical protein